MKNQCKLTALGAMLATMPITTGAAFGDESASSFELPAAPSYEGQGWSIKLSGRTQYDYSQADADNAPGFDIDEAELRRLRLAVSGNLGSNLNYKAEINTNETGDWNFEDAFIEYAPGATNIKIKAGHFKTQNSLDEQTSSRFISTLERAAFTDAFQFNRRVGISVSTSGKAYSLSAGVFGGNLEGGNAGTGFAAAARATYAPILNEDTIVHLGASTRYREQGSDEGLARYHQRPFTHLPGRIISTGHIATSDTFIGAEAALIQGPIWVAGEYGVTFANSDVSGGDADLSGGYIEAGTFIGGKKTYNSGKFNRPSVAKPVTQGGYGAISAVIRYDTIDLADGALDGGQLDTFIAGIDWWPTKYTRVGVNYFNADAALGPSTSGLDSRFAALIAANIQTETVDGVTARIQFDF